MVTYIYSLTDPITKQVRYIGKSNNVKERFKNHNNKALGLGTHKRNWINSLRKNKLKPILEIVDVVPIEQWKYWEVYWISQFKTWGFDLINYTEGGDGATFGNNTSFKKGQDVWNKGKGNTYICEECKSIFKATPASKRRFCSHVCNAQNKSKNLNSGNYKKGVKVWNKNKVGYKLGGLKQSIPVLQFTLKGEFIKEHLGCKEASMEVKCIPESIRLVCIGKNKKAKGYIWKYKINKL